MSRTASREIAIKLNLSMDQFDTLRDILDAEIAELRGSLAFAVGDGEEEEALELAESLAAAEDLLRAVVA